MATTSTASARRKHIDVRGIVQGVGFRPFVYKLAHSLGLTGYVFNSSSGVTIEIEGGEAEIATFLETLRAEPPQLSAIASIAVEDVAACGGACPEKRRRGEGQTHPRYAAFRAAD